jgi:hypothetical protein
MQSPSDSVKNADSSTNSVRMLIMFVYSNESDALKAVEDGHAWGMVRVDHSFTTSLYKRIFESVTNSDLTSIDTDLFNKSTINVRMDVTNQHIAFTLQLKLAEAFEQFMKQLVSVSIFSLDLRFIKILQ